MTRLEKTIKFYEDKLSEFRVAELRQYAEMVRDMRPDANHRQFYLNCLASEYVRMVTGNGK